MSWNTLVLAYMQVDRSHGNEPVLLVVLRDVKTLTHEISTITATLHKYSHGVSSVSCDSQKVRHTRTQLVRQKNIIQKLAL